MLVPPILGDITTGGWGTWESSTGFVDIVFDNFLLDLVF
jgi:hypothetical protein